MSSSSVPADPMPEVQVVAAPRAAALWASVEAFLTRVGDRVNPILVKETRQALKSKQFAITFVLVLALCWLWSIVEIAMLGPQVYYSADGADMFIGYYLILIFCLSLIIPFFTYRSMASEREDNTYELVSITTLRPRQIVAGKLGSAMIQMLVYFSAVAPCLAFTYLLRGIDIVTVGILLFYAVTGSLGLSMIGLFLATLTRLRYVQVLLSVALIAGSILAFIFAWAGTYGMLTFASSFIYDEEFWVVNAVIFTIYITYFIQTFLAATAQLSFPSENRSTALRWGMLLQHACIGGWIAYAWFLESPQAEMVMVLMMLLGIHWYVMGILMAGESTTMSDRVKRSLPQTLVGRLAFTWFGPGPSTGYAFVAVNLLSGIALCLVGMAAAAVSGWPGSGFLSWSTTFAFAALLLAYVVFYLGIGNLLLMFLRRFISVSMVTSIVIQLILIIVLCLVPVVLHLMSRTMFYEGYTLLQMTNVFWSLGIVVDSGSLRWEATVLLFCIPTAAVLVWLANVPFIAAEIRHLRVQQPDRLLAEDAALKAAASGPSSPWDEPPA